MFLIRCEHSCRSMRQEYDMPFHLYPKSYLFPVMSSPGGNFRPDNLLGSGFPFLIYLRNLLNTGLPLYKFLR